MVDSRSGPVVDLFHTLCFRCYHLQMERKRMTRRRRAQAAVRGASDELIDTLRRQPVKSPAPKYRALEHRRRQAQMAARREVEGRRDSAADSRRASRIARAAALAGRAG